MKQNIFISLALVGGLAILASSCVKEITSNDEKYRPAGTPIAISAATSYDNGIETRAEYSGALYGTTTKYERIDWVEGDPICVVYNGSADDYTVAAGSIQSSSEISQATLSGGLQWGDTGSHIFYALYPSGNGAAGSLSNSGYVTGTIPASQDVTSKTISKTETIGTNSYTYNKYQPDTEHYGYLAAYESIGSSDATSSVVLHFRPAFTTFEFKFIRNAGDPNPTIVSAELETEGIAEGVDPLPLTGTFGFQILGKTADGRGARWDTPLPTSITNPGNKITVGFGDGVSIPDGGVLDFSFLALPIDLNGVKITLNYAGGSKKVLRFKERVSGEDVWHPFTGAKKYVITNAVPSGEWRYVIEEIDDIVEYGHTPVGNLGYNVKSYRYNTMVGDSEKEAVKWITQYTFAAPDDPNPNWQTLSSTSVNHPTMSGTSFAVSSLTGNGVSTSTYSAGEDRTAAINGESTYQQHGSPDDPAGAAATAILKAAAPRGTADAPFDLSRHPSYNMDRLVSQTTANSYVVSASGYYMFPCVYGNAITNGKDNKAAYWPSASDAPVTGESFSTLAGVETNKNITSNFWVYYTPRFYNAVNNPIQQPYIFPDLGISSASAEACVLWQDVPAGKEIIPYNTSTPNIGLTSVDGVDYVWFYIDVDDIKPGNIVIAVHVTGVTGVLWSWHIWVTEKDLTPTPADVIHNDAGDYTLMPYNLGWVDTVAGVVKVYDNRTIRYRLVQVDASNNIIPAGDSEEFSVTQIGDSDAAESSIGNNPYYQWGRKDPMIPALSSSVAKTVSPNPDYTSLIYATGIMPASRIGTALNPDFQTGIQQPWLPLSNLIDGEGHGTTSWVGGTYYPWFAESAQNNITLNKVDRGPYLEGQKNDLDAAHVTNFAMWTQSGGLYTYRTDGSYTQTGHTFEDVNHILNIDREAHFDLRHLSGTPGSTAAQRSVSSGPNNLWNSYFYQENLPDCDENKFKTVYDPCPPGFTVPTKKAFIGEAKPGYMTRSGHVNKSTPSRLTINSSSPNNPDNPTTVVSQGVNVGFRFGTIFFPVTGSRTYFTDTSVPSGLVLSPEGHGTTGTYWTDSPFQIDVADPSSSGNHYFAQVNPFSYHHSAYSFIFNVTNNTHIGQSLTRGSAASIRPMVDPKYDNN